MRRLYQFFALLFLVLFVVSFLFGTLISYGVYLITLQMKLPEFVRPGDMVFPYNIYTGLLQGLVFSAVQFFSIVYVFRSAFRHQRKFTVRDMIGYCGLFLGLSALVYIIFTCWFYFSGDFAGLILLSANFFLLPEPLWWVLPLVWIALFIFLAGKIKNKPEYGS